MVKRKTRRRRVRRRRTRRGGDYEEQLMLRTPNDKYSDSI